MNMNTDIPTEQLLTRILHVAKLLTYTKTLSDHEIEVQPSEVTSPIIVGNENSDKNVEKLTERKKM